MTVKVYQDIYNIVSKYLPEDWNEMVFFADYTEETYNMSFYYKSAGQDFVYCFSIPGVTDSQLINSFMAIDEILSEDRSENGEDNAWTVFTMILNNQGKLKVEFDFDEGNCFSENPFAYKENWKNKYLK